MGGPIDTSLFELFKIGPGPSSSHTIGPLRAGLAYRERLAGLPSRVLERGRVLQVELLGSLSATGQGHGSDRAVAAGLLGWRPENIDPSAFNRLWEDHGDRPGVVLAGREFALPRRGIVFGPLSHDHPYSNTMLFRLLDSDGRVLDETPYYSVGGGFVLWPGRCEPARGEPAYPYSTMAGLVDQATTHGLSLADVVTANERAVTGASERDITEGLDMVMAVMTRSVERGLDAHGALPGPIGLRRKAAAVLAGARSDSQVLGRRLLRLNAYALAVSEENAAGGVVVTAPTLGSAGIVPAALALLKNQYRLDRRARRQGLLAAAAVGFLAKANASISGAEVGCQGEVGVASAMAAALFAQAYGESPQVVANAAEIALEHNLGLTCDPVGGYVQIPCIERNAMGAVKALNAYLLAARGDPALHRVGFDQVVEAMLRTGRDMDCRYKETSRGGLAVSVTSC